MQAKSKKSGLRHTGEFGLIRRIKRAVPADAGLIRGIGDDAAVMPSRSGKLLVSTDMMIERVHFDLAYTTFYQLGWKLAAVNISDILAMGGRPASIFVSMAIPGSCRVRDIDEMFRGISFMADKFSMSVAGGDTCCSRSGIALSGAITGYARRAIGRGGAADGHGIFVSGPLGDSALGLLLLKKRKRRILKFSARYDHFLMKSHLMPAPAAQHDLKGVSAMIDVSDGLLSDLSHICDESGTGAVLYKDRIPVSPSLRAVALKLKLDPLNFALRGGEDYVMLFTSARRAVNGAVRIGDVTKKGRYIIDGDGSRHEFASEGYDHFR